MSRRSSFHLTLAGLVSAAYVVYLATMNGRFFFVIPGEEGCPGSELYVDLGRHVARLDEVSGLTAVALGGPRPFGLGLFGAAFFEVTHYGGVVLVMASALALALTRNGRPVRIMACWLLIGQGWELALFAVDLARDTACFERGWSGRQGMLVLLVPPSATVLNAFLLLLAVRRGREIRWRMPAALPRLVVTGLVAGLVAADANRDDITAPDCERLAYTDGIEVGEGPYLCGMRSGGRFATIPDRDLIAYGRAACARHPLRGFPGHDLAPICPLAHRDETAMLAADTATYALGDAVVEVSCDLGRHRPLIRPSHVVGTVTWTDYGAIESWDPGLEEEGEWDLPEEASLIATAPGLLALNVHADPAVCLTAEVYRGRPPVETKGWDHVVEVGYRSLTGHMELYDPMDGTNGLKVPGLRPGDYRIRAHLRESGGDLYDPQTLLLMIFPGERGQVGAAR
ncbi:hypothetical protein [Herbidospora sp. RD11066]